MAHLHGGVGPQTQGAVCGDRDCRPGAGRNLSSTGRRSHPASLWRQDGVNACDGLTHGRDRHRGRGAPERDIVVTLADVPRPVGGAASGTGRIEAHPG
jgi:hypothetical protein